jgi:transposase
MNKQDARFLAPATQNYLRQRAIRLREQGKKFIDIAAYLGVHRNTVAQWWQKYKQYGDVALQQQHRGVKFGEWRTLSPHEEETVQQLMLSHFPDELEIDSALWTRQAVQALIAQQCGVEMPIRTVGEYLKRWGFTPQKPLKRAYEQDPKAVKTWLETEYPIIKQRAQQEGGEIAWGDESGLRSDAQVGRGYAPVGQTPEIHLNTQRVRVNYIASISNQGHVRFSLYTCKLTAAVLLQFMEKLMQGRRSKLFWIIDRHPVHRSLVVQQWLTKHRETMELLYLPAYSPQLNPAEYLNCDVKQGVHSKTPTRNLAQLKRRVSSHLHKLQKLPARVKKYFEHPFIAYAG